MNTNTIFKGLSEFLSKHYANGGTPTHTRIGDKKLGVPGGSYIIPKEDMNTFMKLYHDEIFVKDKMEFLTEKQELGGEGPIAVDFDFRYVHDVEIRQHTTEHIQDMILLYLEEIKEFFIFEPNKKFSVFIMEKPTVNRLEDGSLTKDGIHMIIGIKMDRTMQVMLRERIIQKISEVWELPLINNWDSVFDDGISKGTTNWQMFGSRKPGHQAYELTKHYVVDFDPADSEFMMVESNVKDFDLSKNLVKLSVQYTDNPKFEIQPRIVDEYNRRLTCKKTKKIATKTRVKLLKIDDEDDEDDDLIHMEEIVNKEMLERAVDQMLKNLKTSEYYIKETHDYAQILPEKYYQPGSHLINRQVAFALKHTDDRLFLSWVMLRSKADDFDYSSIVELYSTWKKHFNVNKGSSECVTRKSIMYWAKQDALEDFEKVKKSTIDHFIDHTIQSPTEFDFAMVLYQMYKEKYVCSSISEKGWFVFKDHRWEPDYGHSLRLSISKDMFSIYQNKIEELVNERQHCDDESRKEIISKKLSALITNSMKLKKTADKNNIMREAMELFYDKDFIKSIDSNRFLLCFKNGVVDFKAKIFRDGYPQDYITKSTNTMYEEYSLENEHHEIMGKEIIQFMEQLFPVNDMNRYMWDYCASCLIGTNVNQTFNIFLGSGSNGKSRFVDLMTYALGEYKGTVPITLVSEKRNGIGGTSSEVIQLKGIRLAVMQEPSKDTKINEGVLKELTGGDPIQARALYSESETFIPQFKLCVCTNVLFDIGSNDDGTWRRMKQVDFVSKFIGENETHTDTTKYVFPKDKELEEKLPRWANVFGSMLVKRAFETNGFVADCDDVIAASNKYRQSQDHLAGFIGEMVMKTDKFTDVIKKRDLCEEFKNWFQESQGLRKMPKGKELHEYMDKKFGKCKQTGWHGVKIIRPELNDEMVDLED